MIILFGSKGCGKSFFGKKLAEQLQIPFLDTDLLIGLKYKELFACDEKLFREKEREVILSLQKQKAVVAVGGGSVLDSENTAHLLKIGSLIYLETLSAPIERQKIYENIPAYTVHLDGKTEEQILWDLIDLGTSLPLQRGENLTEKQLEL